MAHSIYGIPSTINSANYVYFLALEKCYSLDSPTAMNVFVKELLNLHRGQGDNQLKHIFFLCYSYSEKTLLPNESQCVITLDSLLTYKFMVGINLIYAKPMNVRFINLKITLKFVIS